VAAASLSFLVTLGLAELALRWFAPVPYSDNLPWIPDGHIKGRAEPDAMLRNATGHEVRINQLGFRGPDWDWQPPAGTLRVLALGGSATFNFTAEGEANTWPGRLQQLLSEALPVPVEVVNLGLPGFDTANSKVNYLFTGRALHPHVIVVYHTWNDMKAFRVIDDGTAGVPRAFHAIGGRGPLWRRIARTSQIGRRTHNMLGGHRRVRLMVENSYTSLEKEGERAHAPPGAVAMGWFESNFRDLVRFALADGVLPVLATQATIAKPERLSDHEYRLLIAADVVGMTKPVIAETWPRCNDIIRDVARETGAVFVDGYGEVPSDLVHLTDFVHLTDAGRDSLARVMARSMLSDEAFQEIVQRIRGARTSVGIDSRDTVGSAGQ
jgi:hypothetical protein